MTGMIIRLVLSLALVAAVLWFAARVAKRRGIGQGNGLIEVVARQRMGRSSSVNLLGEVDPGELEAPEGPEAPGTASPGSGFPSAASAWKAVLENLRDRTVRRS